MPYPTPKRQTDASTSHPRKTLLRLVHTDEGITKSDLAKATGSGWGTLCHHLARLERDGLIQTFHHGRCTHLFPVPRTQTHMHTAAVLRRPSTKALLRLLQERNELTVPVAMAHTGLSRYVATSTLEEMECVGILERVGLGRPRYQRRGADWGTVGIRQDVGGNEVTVASA